jgi:hypothetical protein
MICLNHKEIDEFVFPKLNLVASSKLAILYRQVEYDFIHKGNLITLMNK